MRLLVVEDDRAVAGLLRQGLTQEQHVVDVAHDGKEGLDLASSGIYDAIILDVMMPGLDGLEVARRLRAVSIGSAILMLTARGSLNDRLHGFDAGADDYLTKPFAFEELLARLRAITRRAGAPSEDDRLVVGNLVLDRRTHAVTRGGRPIMLARKEYALLEYLMRHPGQVLSRTLIQERVWDYTFEGFSNVVDASVRRLRKAIDEEYDSPLIETVRGVGYRIRE